MSSVVADFITAYTRAHLIESDNNNISLKLLPKFKQILRRVYVSRTKCFSVYSKQTNTIELVYLFICAERNFICARAASRAVIFMREQSYSQSR